MIQPMVRSQEKGELFCFIANMHSLTSLFDRGKLLDYTKNAMIDMLALGIDPDKSVFWVQSDVPEVAELTWYLNNVTPVGLLERCHSYKDKVAKGLTATNGLFSYPVLMAADILLYQSNVVPVGKGPEAACGSDPRHRDQIQRHLWRGVYHTGTADQ